MKRLLAGHAILCSVLCVLLLGACSSTSKPRVQASLTRDKADAPADLEQVIDETYDSMFSLMAPLYLFYAQHDRWPSDARELQGLTRQLGLSFDLTRFSQIDLREMHDGSLQVKFELAPPSHGGGEFVISKPKFEEDSEILTGHTILT